MSDYLSMISPYTAGAGALIGGISGWNQAREARKQARQHNKNIDKALEKLRSRKSDTLTTMRSQYGNALNQYSMAGKEKSPFYQSIASQALSTGHSTLGRIDDQATKLESSRMRVPSKNTQWLGALSGALGAGMGVAGMFNDMSTKKDLAKYNPLMYIHMSDNSGYNLGMEDLPTYT